MITMVTSTATDTHNAQPWMASRTTLLGVQLTSKVVSPVFDSLVGGGEFVSEDGDFCVTAGPPSVVSGLDVSGVFAPRVAVVVDYAEQQTEHGGDAGDDAADRADGLQ